MDESSANAVVTLDQLSGFAREMAPILGQYHRDLRHHGVPPLVAKSLIEQMQGALLAKMGFFPSLSPQQ